MAGAGLTVQGGRHGAGAAAIPLPSLIQGVAGGLLAMLSYAGTTLLARYAVPRYGALQVLFLEIVGGVVVLGVVLPLSGHTPLPPHTVGAWIYVLLLSLGSVLAANFLFFAAVKRIDAAPTAVAATIEPVVGTLLALILFNQRLSPSAGSGSLWSSAAWPPGISRKRSPLPPNRRTYQRCSPSRSCWPRCNNRPPLRPPCRPSWAIHRPSGGSCSRRRHCCARAPACRGRATGRRAPITHSARRSTPSPSPSRE